jgi:cell division septation protein DedD
MPLPHRCRTLRATLPVLLIGLLAAACSGNRPQISAQQEAGTYKARAHRNYTPPGPASDPWGPYIVEAAARFDVPERWVREVIRQESGGRLYQGGDLITSGAGAMGLMQVMPGTYDELRSRYDLADDPYDPHNNILAGTAYVREMYDIFGSPGFLAAYNAGPGRLDDFLTRNRTLPDETRRYVAKIGARIEGEWPQRRSAAEGTQMAMLTMDDVQAGGTRYGRGRNSGGTAYAAYVPPIHTARPQAPLQAYALNDAPRYAPRPSASAPVRQSYVEVAQLPSPPRYMAPPPVVYSTQPSLSVASRETRGFSLVSPAMAEPVGIRRGGSSSGGWAIQVGAMASEGLAQAAASSARGQARDTLGSARTQVTQVRQGGGMLYRARLTGLSRDAAAQACERLRRQGCIMVSPDAQS